MTEPVNADVPRVPAVEVYSTLGCQFCRIAKAKLNELGVPFVSVDIQDPSARDALLIDNGDNAVRMTQRILQAQQNTVPQIYVDDEYVGGCTELLAESVSFPDSESILAQRLQRKGIQSNANTKRSIHENDKDHRPQMSTTDFTPLNGEPLNSLRFAGLAGQEVLREAPMSAVKLSKQLQISALALTDKFASSDGKRVQYAAMVSSPEFAAYVSLSCRLQQCSLRELATLTHFEKIAFYSNLYNALIIHANCVLRTKEICAVANDTSAASKASLTSPEAIAQRSLFFSGATGAVYRIGGTATDLPSASADQCDTTVNTAGNTDCDTCACASASIDVTPDIIEHAILRANLPHPSQVSAALQRDSTATTHTTTAVAPGPDTTATDIAKDPARDTMDSSYYYNTLSYLPSEHLIVVNQLPIGRDSFDPRVHFILNCGALSCPPIKVLDCDAQQDGGGNVDAALGAAAAAYLHGEVSVDLVQKQVFLPRLLLWYGQDFGTSLVAVLSRAVAYMSEGSAAKAVLQALVFRAAAAGESGLGVKRVLFVAENTSADSLRNEDVDLFTVKYNPYDWSLNSE